MSKSFPVIIGHTPAVVRDVLKSEGRDPDTCVEFTCKACGDPVGVTTGTLGAPEEAGYEWEDIQFLCMPCGKRLIRTTEKPAEYPEYTARQLAEMGLTKEEGDIVHKEHVEKLTKLRGDK